MAPWGEVIADAGDEPGVTFVEMDLAQVARARGRVPSLSHDVEPWQWSSYVPTWVDYGLIIGSFGWFFMWFLLFVKQLPVMALAEIKEIVPPKMKRAHATHGQGGH